jgi:hypothetical protein
MSIFIMQSAECGASLPVDAKRSSLPVYRRARSVYLARESVLVGSSPYHNHDMRYLLAHSVTGKTRRRDVSPE